MKRVLNRIAPNSLAQWLVRFSYASCSYRLKR